MAEQRIKVWKFINADHKLRYDDGREIVAGVPLSVERMPKLCSYGIHGCVQASNALTYAPGTHVAYGYLSGALDIGTDKIAGQTFEPVAVFDATRVLVRFAVWCAEQALKEINPSRVDKRSVQVIRVVKRWLNGKATQEELNAARAAAGAVYAAAHAAADAADAAARAVYAAAHAAAHAADAADAAARAAAGAVYAAVYAAAHAAAHAADAADAAARAAAGAAADAAADAAGAAVYAAADAADAAHAAAHAADAAAHAARTKQETKLARLLHAEMKKQKQ